MKTCKKIGTGAVAAMAALGIGIPAASAAQPAPAAMAHATVATAHAYAPAFTLGWPVLRQGSNAQLPMPRATVRSLQYLLNAHGARVAVDGIFGARTKAAVVAFQRAHRLSADGVVGAASWKALIRTVRFGSGGNAVRAVQDQANARNLKNGHSLVVDGIFGAKTRAWVVGFQKAMATMVPGFAVDGIVGTQTWAALVGGALAG